MQLETFLKVVTEIKEVHMQHKQEQFIFKWREREDVFKSDQGFVSDMEEIWWFVRENKWLYNVKYLWLNQISVKTIEILPLALTGLVFYYSISVYGLKLYFSIPLG